MRKAIVATAVALLGSLVVPMASYADGTGTAVDGDVIAYSRADIDGKTHYYAVFNNWKSFDDATFWAGNVTFKGLWGHLPTITSERENKAVAAVVSYKGDSVWLGLKDTTHDSAGTPPRTWKWVTGPEDDTLVTSCESFRSGMDWNIYYDYGDGGCSNTSAYSNLNDGEPNNSYGLEGHAEMYPYGGKWNDTAAMSGCYDYFTYNYYDCPSTRAIVVEFTADSILPAEQLRPATDVYTGTYGRRADVYWNTPTFLPEGMTYEVTIRRDNSDQDYVTSDETTRGSIRFEGLPYGQYLATVTVKSADGASVAAPAVPFTLTKNWSNDPLPADAFTIVAAAPRADVLFDTGSEYSGPGATHTANGTAWYFSDSYSWGFAKAGDDVQRGSCDVAGIFAWTPGPNGGARLCWHTSEGFMTNGFRAGMYNVNDSGTTYRAVYESDSPTYYPFGPDSNISQQRITDGGWTLCFSNISDKGTALIADILEACDGDYLMLAGMAGPNTHYVTATAPGVPSDVSATAGDGEATVSWSAPASNGGAAISGYTVTASPGGATCATTGELSCTVTGLDNFTGYTFTVTATNSVGDSDTSDASDVVIPNSGEFQIWLPNSGVIAVDGSVQVWVFGATGLDTVKVRIGVESFEASPDASGIAVVDFTAGSGSGLVRTGRVRVTATAVRLGEDGSKEKLRASAMLFVPTTTLRKKWREGGAVSVRVRGAGEASALSFRIDGTEVCATDADDRGRATCTFDAPTEGDYTLQTFVGGQLTGENDFSVIAWGRRPV